jgi:hypothetical protein
MPDRALAASQAHRYEELCAAVKGLRAAFARHPHREDLRRRLVATERHAASSAAFLGIEHDPIHCRPRDEGDRAE